MKVYSGETALRALRREATLLTWIDHPGITRVHEVGLADGQAYMIMDLVDGRPLAGSLVEGPLPVDETVRIGLAVAEVLAAVHRGGLVHRDVKPQNIMLEPGGRARLIDFGMAARADRDCGDMAAGTFLYAAPEQTGMIKRPVDGRSDLYALGAVLFECLTGTTPFVAEDTGTLLHMHAVTPAPPVTDLRPDVPAGLAAAVAKLLAKDPDDRYATAGNLIADLAGSGHPPDGPPAGRLIGRDTQIERLRAAWRRAKAGQGGVAVITGGPGAGKTRMAREIATHARDDGGAVLYARCVPGSAPLAAIRVAVEQYLADEDRTEQVRAAGTTANLGSLSPALGTPDDDAADPARLSRDIAGFLTGLAGVNGGLLFCLDDVHVADEASVAVLTHLAGLVGDCPLLLVGTAPPGDGPMPHDASPSGDGQSGEILLDALDTTAVRELVMSIAHGLELGDELVHRLASRGGVTPFEVIEYVRAVAEAGLLFPHWGRWALDEGGLDAVTLPDDVYGLMLRRMGGLDAESRRVLTIAAAIGPTFEPGLLGTVTGPDDAVHTALDEAIGCGVLEHRGELLAFVHEGIRSALLAGLDEPRLRETHQDIAEAMDRAAGDDPDRVYATARQYLAGHPDRVPDRVARVCFAAGRSALARYASAEAVEFLEAVPRRPDVDELLATAYYQAGRFTEASETFTRALADAPSPLDRARVLDRLAELQQAVGDLAGSQATVRRALAELGRPWPANLLLLTITTLVSMVVCGFVERTGIGFGTADPEQQARHRLRARLYYTASLTAILMLDPVGSVALTLRGLYPASRLGVCAEYVIARGATAGLFMALGLPSLRSYALAGRAAAELGDPAISELLAWGRRALPPLLGHTSVRDTVPAVLDRARVVDTGRYFMVLENAVFMLLDSGFAEEAYTLYEEGTRRLAAADQSEHSVVVWGVAAAAARGRVAEADALQRRSDERTPRFVNHSDRQTRLHSAIRAAVEQRDFGAFDTAVDEYAAMRLKPMVMPLYRRTVYASIAYGRIEQCLADPGPEALARAEQAVRGLKKAMTGGKVLAAHHAIARAYLRHLAGDHDGALAGLAGADADAPLVTYESARLRARALAALDRTDDAAAHAATALTVAERHGWPHRARWIRSAFDMGGVTAGTASLTVRGAASGTFSVERQRLAAVERLSVAASRILDPAELTRVALDEVIRLLGAERAYLFLADDTGRLVPYRGRDVAGTDLTTLTEYGSTLVEQVRAGGETLVVTGTEEGVALGSQSVLAHGLRSIMVAPLLLDGRLLGVVYLDSRLAKGMFTEADAGVLTALTTHVATGLETARAAELAVAVQSARRERDIAETMRDAAAYLAGTLDPAAVLKRLHATVRRALPASRSWLAVLDGDKIRVSDENDDPIVAADVGGLLGATGPVTGSDPLIETSAGEPWLALPLRARDDAVGFVVLATQDPAGFRDGQVEIGAALAAQGMTAYENARLFAEVERLATTDGLTGLFNRRHFFTLAVRELAFARRRSSPLAAIMLDIDHFKQINDRYGHPVGDEVIATVARRLSATARTTDVICRYGGEEFTILLPDTDDEGAGTLAERLRASVSDRPIETKAGLLPVTISVGVSGLDGADGSVGDLLGRADEALYQAKRDGRNRVARVCPQPGS